MNDLETVLDFPLQEKVSAFLDTLIKGVILEIQSKNLTGFGPSNASGDLISSVTKELTDDGGIIEINGYAYQLVFGRKPGTMPPVDEIQRWIDKKGLDLNAYAVAKSIQKKGTTIYMKYSPGESGLFEDTLGEDNLETFLNELSDDIISSISSQILNL